ncbi:MFS transporter [Planotetraspora sp. A-T 1434]|uniref:MFS transporter n=1 Tax=Planotetraspora sp. A-T 1434 TaxID=2979219 RepID=UPI0021BE887B|nr:MFS transporter [Planotetraspora sp. A-T 1434]MCT9933184.1 MFS transporter [Planotetraspora sp. A-T 1434]
MDSTNTEAGSGVRAGPREWLGLAVLALPTLLLALDTSILYLALPHLSADLGATATQQLWITDIYGFLTAGFLVTMGRLGDLIGRRRLLLIGGAAFAAASLAAAYSTSAEMLIISRALLGVAGATLMPSTMALLVNMFKDPRQMGTAISVWMACFMGGMALGPVVGGVMLQNFWWGSVFLLGVPVMLLLLVAGPALLPEFRDPNAVRLDLTSVALSLAAILPLIYGLKELARNGWGPLYAVAVVVGIVMGALFVRRQRRLASPLLDLRLFGNRTFRAALIVMVLGGVINGSYFLINIFLQTVKGLSPLETGLWMLPSTTATIVSVLLAPVIARRIRPGYVLAAGLVILAAGYVLLSQADGSSGLALVIAGLVIASFGVGPLGSLGNGLVMGSVTPEKAGAASSISETSAQFGSALGIAALGSVGAAVYHSQLAVPAGVPAGAADTAREGIPDAIAAAQHLAAPLASELLHAAREAFTTAVNAATAVSAVLALALAILAGVTLRHVPSAGQPATPPDEPPQDETGEVSRDAAPSASSETDPSASLKVSG